MTNNQFLIPAIEDDHLVQTSFLRKDNMKEILRDRAAKHPARGNKGWGDIDLTPVIPVRTAPAADETVRLTGVLEEMSNYLEENLFSAQLVRDTNEPKRTLQRGQRILTSLERMPEYVQGERVPILELIRQHINSHLMSAYLKQRIKDAGWEHNGCPPDIREQQRLVNERVKDLTDNISGLEQALIVAESQLMLNENSRKTTEEIELAIRAFTKSMGEVSRLATPEIPTKHAAIVQSRAAKKGLLSRFL